MPVGLLSNPRIPKTKNLAVSKQDMLRNLLVGPVMCLSFKFWRAQIAFLLLYRRRLKLEFHWLCSIPSYSSLAVGYLCKTFELTHMCFTLRPPQAFVIYCRCLSSSDAQRKRHVPEQTTTVLLALLSKLQCHQEKHYLISLKRVRFFKWFFVTWVGTLNH